MSRFTAPVTHIRRGLSTLLNEGRDVEDRLTDVLDQELFGRLGIASLSMLLYWWRPDRYPPFNVRTRQFLADIRLATRGASAASPATYRRWLAYADEIAREYRLPSRGHVDLMVSEYREGA